MKDINFLVEEKPFENQLQKEKKSTPAVKIIVLLLVIAVGTLILLAPGIYVKTLKGRALSIENKLTDQRFSEVRSIKAMLTQVTDKVNGKKAIINSIDAEYIPASQILLIIENNLPSGCYVKSLNFNGNSFSINVVAENSFIASDFFGNMDRLQLFSSNSEGLSIEESKSDVEFSVTYNAQTGGGIQK